MRKGTHAASLHSPLIVVVLAFASGVWFGALLPDANRPCAAIGVRSQRYADQMLRASFMTQASEGAAIIPGVATDWIEGKSVDGGSNGREGSGGKSSEGSEKEDEGNECTCGKKSNSASELMGAFGESGLGQLALPSISKEDALAKIDALQRARTHLAKEKANLEGERNALNKVVKEAQREVAQCTKELKKKRPH